MWITSCSHLLHLLWIIGNCHLNFADPPVAAVAGERAAVVHGPQCLVRWVVRESPRVVVHHSSLVGQQLTAAHIDSSSAAASTTTQAARQGRRGTTTQPHQQRLHPDPDHVSHSATFIKIGFLFRQANSTQLKLPIFGIWAWDFFSRFHLSFELFPKAFRLIFRHLKNVDNFFPKMFLMSYFWKYLTINGFSVFSSKCCNLYNF